MAVREELGLEALDCGASKVFAVADHQVAHIYLNDPSLEAAVRELLAHQPGVEIGPWRERKKPRCGLDHPRAGDLIAVAGEGAWFTYYYWLEDARAPDFARCVDIHRKPGYDPVELFLDPKIAAGETANPLAAAAKEAGFPHVDGCHPAGCESGERLAWPARPGAGGAAGFHLRTRRGPLPPQMDSTGSSASSKA